MGFCSYHVFREYWINNSNMNTWDFVATVCLENIGTIIQT